MKFRLMYPENGMNIATHGFLKLAQGISREPKHSPPRDLFHLLDQINEKDTNVVKMFPFTATVWCFLLNLDVSKNSGTPKWMVYNGKPY